MTSRRIVRLSAALLAPAFMLSACDNSGNAAPGAVSEGEAQALEEAAEMLEERRLPEGTLPPIDAPIEARPAEAPQETQTQ